MKTARGFTLIELIVYICITSIVLMSSLSIAFLIINDQIKESVIAEVRGNGDFSMEKISYYAQRASAVNTQTVYNSNPGKLVLDYASNPQITIDAYDKTITLNGQAVTIKKLRLKQGSGQAIDLTSDRVEVINFSLLNLSGTNAVSIEADLSLKSVNPSSSAIYASENSWSVPVTVRTK
ncbi:MAG: prepilin-type N-terminal cleavage/methylation domain-containing protein [Parcubacteria group bacterium]